MFGFIGNRHNYLITSKSGDVNYACIRSRMRQQHSAGYVGNDHVEFSRRRYMQGIARHFKMWSLGCFFHLFRLLEIDWSFTSLSCILSVETGSDNVECPWETYRLYGYCGVIRFGDALYAACHGIRNGIILPGSPRCFGLNEFGKQVF